MLNQKEINQIGSLLKKIDNPGRGLPQPVFDAFLKIVPFIGCELVLMRKSSEQSECIRMPQKELLLVWRDDKWFKGWHFPGGLLRYKESFKKRLSEVAKNELGVELKKYKFLFPLNYTKCPRGHGVSLVFLCEISGMPKTGKFFKKMPKNIIREHIGLWKRLKATRF